jgi:N-acetylmuramoyl-L-alanine amidase
MRSKNIILLGLSTLLIFGSLSAPAYAGVRVITSHGKKYVPLKNISDYYGMTISQSGKDRIRIQSQWNTLEFETNSRRCWVNDTLLWLNHPARKIGGQWAIEDDDFDKLIDPAVRPYAFLKNANSRVVVLDPGHGGKDKGAVSPRKVYEKLVVMDVAKRVRNKLQARGLTVHLTRDSDQTLSLSERTKKAARWNADLFISIHADSAGKTAQGAGGFVLSLPGCYSTHSYGKGKASATVSPGNKFDLANMILGYRIQQNLVKTTRQSDRGVKHARFQVLREAPCPAALIEVAFLSNAKEEALVIRASHRDKIATGIANGIAAYLNDIKRAK